LYGGRWKSPKGLDGGEGEATGGRGTVKLWKEKMGPVDCGKKSIYTFITRNLRTRSRLSGKPGYSGKKPRDSAPPESSEQICREFDFG
jgi:hypothetical protein